ncbi:aldose 1-epimerase family protein [Micrococcus sp.]|uniref:aldose 1-epimerase family protein n=1 Tax=Micrococcus sp. TaxID=1271 RepID=UPI002A91BDF3|nr:aldose 1-epimerase family protein [Micrococcus sp.]MDY6055368.1 aldose 1-epimerase family protein [Micrococcus sp.]
MPSHLTPGPPPENHPTVAAADPLAGLVGGPEATGTQHRLVRGAAEAVVVGLAAALRTYRVDGVDLVEPYGPDQIPPAGNGIQMSPWPNRVAGGRWTLDGAEQQLDITEPARGNASHGLLRNTHLVAEERQEHAVTLRGEIHPQHGWPFRMTHRVRYELAEDGGLTVTMSLTNLTDRPAPAAFGAHPFLRLGQVPSDQLRLRVDAAERVLTGEDLIPTGTGPVEGTEDDFRSGRVLGAGARDVALTGLVPDADGLHRAHLVAPDGRSVTLWSEPAFAWTHVFVTDRLPQRPTAVAVEPLTAPANALNTGEGLAWLEPGHTLTARWGITAHLTTHSTKETGA